MPEEKMTRADQLLACLKSHSDRPLKAGDISDWIFKSYPSECEEKKQRSTRSMTDSELVKQIANEVNSAFKRLQKDYKQVKRQGPVSNYEYYWEENGVQDNDGDLISAGLFKDTGSAQHTGSVDNSLKSAIVTVVDFQIPITSEINDLKSRYHAIYPRLGINPANLDSLNESQCRILIDRILQDVLGYDIIDIKTELRIYGGPPDYMLSLDDNKAVLVIEAKSGRTRLQKPHVDQVTSYAARYGIRWALLTNVKRWELYRVTVEGKVQADLVFFLDLLDIKNDLDDKNAKYLLLISKIGMTHHSELLEQLWHDKKLLGKENLCSVIFGDTVFSKIRDELKAQNCSSTDDEIKEALQNLLRR